MYKSCAFTGHRDFLEDLNYSLLDSVIENLIKTGTEVFYCGMAVGFDLSAAETVIKLKEVYDVKLIACIPCPEQSFNFSESNLRRYERIIKNSDEVIYISPHYFEGCMLKRDRFMVDNCDVLVCYLRKNNGGTYYTVNYAKRQGIKIIEL